MSILRKEWTRKACGEPGRIFSRSWVREEAPPKAVLVIAHGMAEHSARYDHFASFLAERGYAVYMNDHAGHGRSAQINGHFADRNGWENVVNDLNALMDEAQKEHPGLPLFLMGHSMGSFLLRQYLTMYGNGLSGAVIMGTGHHGALVLDAGLFMCRVIALFKGWKYRSKFINDLSFGGYNKNFRNDATGATWLSANVENCERYAEDPLCSFMFTVNGYYQMFKGLKVLVKKGSVEKIPKELPILFVAGTEDPVGNFGKSVRKVYGKYRAAGIQDVKIKLYKGDRHEILNETDRQQVYADLYRWMRKRI